MNKLILSIFFGTVFFILQLLLTVDLHGQVPVISYSTPKVYISGLTINPLVPNNTGGAIPSNAYHVVSTVAGNGGQYSQDGTGTGAAFNMPSGIATDQLGNIYVSDYGSDAIRKISTAGVVTTIGNVSIPTGLAVDRQGNVFVTSFQEDRVYKINPQGGKVVFAGSGLPGAQDGQGASASFRNLGGIKADAAGNLYVAEQGNHQIRKISSSGLVSTIAGTGTAGAANGPAASATFNAPDGLTIDLQGNIFVADTKNNKIRKISSDGIVTTLAGSGIAGLQDGKGAGAIFNYPTSLALDAMGNLYVADFRNNIIRKILSDGTVTTLAGNGNTGSTNGAVLSANFNGPLMLAVDPSGNLNLTDFLNNLIRKVTLTGFTIDKALPEGLSFDASNGKISGTATKPSPATEYRVTAYNASGSSSTIINITVIPAGSITFHAIPDKMLCDADFDPGASSTEPIIYTSSNPLVATIVAGKIHIIGAGTAVITASNGITSENQQLIVRPLITPSVRITPNMFSSCEGMELTYTAIATDEGSNPTYKWSLNGIDVAINGPKFTSKTFIKGDKITCVVINNDACVPVSSLPSTPVSLTTDPYVTVSIEISASLKGEICEGTPVTFTAIPSTNVQDTPLYLWQVNGLGIGETSQIFTTSTLQDGDRVTCIMTTFGGCVFNSKAFSNVITTKVLSKEACLIKIPNSFSPNGDGVNDTWKINGLAAYSGCSVKIFNRNGAAVYQSTGYSIPWDGLSNGKPVPTGVYYYVILFGNEKQKKSGSIVLLH